MTIETFTPEETFELGEQLGQKARPGEVYCLDGLRIPIPRHNEVSERTTLDIINESEQKLGKGWWQ